MQARTGHTEACPNCHATDVLSLVMLASTLPATVGDWKSQDIATVVVKYVDEALKDSPGQGIRISL